MILQALVTILLSQPSSDALYSALSRAPESSESLFETKAQFSKDVPFVSLVCGSRAHPGADCRFLLDSGCYASFKLNVNGSPKGERVFFSVTPQESMLSGLSHLMPIPKEFNPSLFDYLTKSGYEGILGADFFRQHDVVIDYASRKLYLSPILSKAHRWDAYTSFSLETASKKIVVKASAARAVPLIDVDGGMSVVALMNRQAGRKTLIAVLDTATGISNAPASYFESGPLTNSESATLMGVHQDFIGKTSTEVVRIPGWTVDRKIQFFVGGECATLTPRDLGRMAYISFAGGVAYFWD